MRITIPKPCHENWDAMSPREQGRFCTACAQTVVDFTLLSDDEVQRYFLDKAGEKTCGRFKQTQLATIVINLPENILLIRMPLWKRFLTAALIVFGMTLFSCNTNYENEKINVATLNPGIATAAVRNLSPGYVGGIVVKFESFDSIPEKKSCSSDSFPIVGEISFKESEKKEIKTLLDTTYQNPQATDTNPINYQKEKKLTKANRTDSTKILKTPVIDSCENKSYQ